MNRSRAELMRKIPLFATLDDEALERVAAHAMEFEVEPGHVLVQPGTAGSGVFAIATGSALVELPGGKTFQLGDGDVFGELSLLTDNVRTGRVRTTTDVTGFAISRVDFSKLLEDEPKLAVQLLRVLANRLLERG